MILKKVVVNILIVAVFVVSMANTASFLCVSANAQEIEQLAWSQSVIDNAVAESLYTGGYMNTTTNDFAWSNTLKRGPAMYMLALMSYYNPNLASTGGVKVSNRLLQHIRNFISSGKEPSCTSGLGGWVDNSVAQTLALAKNTPVVWNSLSQIEKDRCDFIMKAMVVVGNLTFNYYSNPKTDMVQKVSWEKSWNPNHVEGYVGVMIAAHIYFGGKDAVNAILTSFSFDAYIATMTTYGFNNMKYTYNRAGKTLMESGGTDARGGTLVGAKRSFEYKDILTGAFVPYEPLALYRSLSLRMYYHKCQSTVYDYDNTTVRGSIFDSTISPYEGQVGMAYELISSDEYGRRTSTEYVFTGWRNNITTRATLQALGYWEGTYSRDIQQRMYIGTMDFIYKNLHGYKGYSMGKVLSVYYENQFTNNGYTMQKEIWEKFIKPNSFNVESKMQKSGTTLTSTITLNSNFSGKTKTVIAWLAIYNGEKLVDLTQKTYSIANGVEKGINTFAQTLPAGYKAKLMVWEDGSMEPLAGVITQQ